MQRTAVIFDSESQGIKFFVFDKDLDFLDGCYINDATVDSAIEAEMLKLFYPNNDGVLINGVDKYEFMDAIESNAFLIVCGEHA